MDRKTRKKRCSKSSCVGCKTIQVTSKSKLKKKGAKLALQNQTAADKYKRIRIINNKASKKFWKKKEDLLKRKKAEEAEKEEKRCILQLEYEKLKKKSVKFKKLFKLILKNCAQYKNSPYIKGFILNEKDETWRWMALLEFFNIPCFHI